jgi:hypothetical protein
MGLLYYPKTRKTQGRTKSSAFCVSKFLTTACILCTGFLLFSVNKVIGQVSLLEKNITIPKQHTTLYNALNLISDKADVLFVYDSQIVESDKRVKLVADNQPLKQVLDNILENPQLTYKVIGQHILIYKIKSENRAVSKPQPVITVKDSIKNILITGHIFDDENKATIPYATIGILEENIGTISNADGYFALKVPASFSGSSLIVSHMGHMSQRIPVQLLNEQQVDIYLKRRIISIQEVIIRYIDPNTIVSKAMEQRKNNYSLDPVYTTSFYREGVQKNNRYISYSEAVFKVYKSSFEVGEYFDQVKLLKSRKIQNSDGRDTVFLKLKAGVQSALQLDIVKSVPDFLDLSQSSQYTYTYSDMVSYNSRDAYAITFVQNEDIKEALYSGTLYIDKENFAMLGADFEINPAFLDKAAENLILKKSRKLIVKLEKISYSISYIPFNGKYYLNHVRCDIKLKTRLRQHLSYDNFNTFLELATCHIDTANVVKFARQEVIKPNVVFSDAPYSNDNTFWGDYNTIVPEAKLSEALSKIIGKIEEIE